MDIAAIFLMLTVMIVVGMYVGQPYLQRRGFRLTREGREHSTLLAEYDRIVNALQELEFDQSLGKIPAEDYPEQRTELLAKGAHLLRKIDASSGEEASHDVESRIESVVAAQRADASASTPSVVLDDDELESMLVARRKNRKDKSAGFCPKCGKPILVSDSFCPSCGKAIS